MLTTDAINDFKDFIDNIIAYAKVTVNGVSEKKVIHRRERLKDGRVAVYVQIADGGIKYSGDMTKAIAAEPLRCSGCSFTTRIISCGQIKR